MVTENGIDKVDIINRTLDKYGDLTGNELVKITHRKNSPWYKSGQGKGKFQEIKDETIKEFHYIENI